MAWIEIDLSGDWNLIKKYAQQFPVRHERAVRRVLSGIGQTTKTELRKVIKSGNFPLTAFSVLIKQKKGLRTEPLRATDQLLTKIRGRMKPRERMMEIFWGRADSDVDVALLVERGHNINWTKRMVDKIMYIIGILPLEGDKKKAAIYHGFLRKRKLSMKSQADDKGTTQFVKGRYFAQRMINDPRYRQAVRVRMGVEYHNYMNPRRLR